MKDPKLVLITGESGSGKTTIAKALIETLNDKDVFLLEMDKYFIPYNKRETERKRYDDNSPSARVYKNNFLCATENLHLNYFDFIRKYYDLADDDAVKDKMKELKKLVMQQNQ